MLLLAVILISYIHTSACVKPIPGQPVPHAEVLEEILSRHLINTSYTDNSVNSLFLDTSKESNDTRDVNYKDENLDIKILDVDNVRKIINLYKKHHMRQQNARRYDGLFYYDPNKNPIVNQIWDLILQTMYQTKYRINDSRPYRQKYAYGRVYQHSYTIAVLYGAGTALIGKMESLIGQLRAFSWYTHFVWYIIIYEKLLACNIDIENIIERIFSLQADYELSKGPKDVDSLANPHSKKAPKDFDEDAKRDEEKDEG